PVPRRRSTGLGKSRLPSETPMPRSGRPSGRATVPTKTVSATSSLSAPPEGNGAEEERFGHVFLIRASGRTAPELLAALRQRLANDPDTEWGVVAEELREITRLRLE